MTTPHDTGRLRPASVWRLPLSFLLLASFGLPAQGSELGFSSTPPEEGPVVEVEGGYLVPYEEEIPGTGVRFVMTPIPGGEFLMGSPEDEPGRREDEGPQVRVQLEPFWMGACEVTWGEYRNYMATYEAFKQFQQLALGNEPPPADAPEEVQAAWKLAHAHAVTGKLAQDPENPLQEISVDAVSAPTPLYDTSYTYSVGEEDEQPAVTMTQFAARQYTKWLSRLTGRRYRLPTEAEWEYAARAGSTTAWSFGEDPADLDAHAWYIDNSDWETHPVGSKEANAWGLYDMYGNAAEWTLDEYLPDAYADLAPGPVTASDAVRWPTELWPRTIRGGSWLDEPEMLRSAARFQSEEEEWKLADPNSPLSPWWYTEELSMGIGMRVVRPWQPLATATPTRLWEADVEDMVYDINDRLEEGRGILGVADPELPAARDAIEMLRSR